MPENSTALSRAVFHTFVFVILVASAMGSFAQKGGGPSFPATRPENGNFNRPEPGEELDISPPGFCWWRAAEAGKVSYRLRILDARQKEVYVSPALQDPAHVPDKILPPGKYAWIVQALAPSNPSDQSDSSDKSDKSTVSIPSITSISSIVSAKVLAERAASSFTILENAIPLPWVSPRELLGRAPREHPRLLFLKAKLPEIRQTLGASRKAAFDSLKAAADKSLSLPLMKKPDFDKYVDRKDYAAKRTAYKEAYSQFESIYNGGAVPMALMYALTGETKYGEAAKAQLLNLLDWPLDGIATVDDPRFDEIGLNLARTAPEIYDWCYGLFSEKERQAVENMLVARGDKLLARMQRRDFLNTPAESHDGRVPGYLLEFAIALADRPQAEAWLNYGMKAVLTVFPHWGDRDGGWAEGVDYALAYNDRFITPLQSVYTATGYDLWQKPFFRKFPYFLISCISPRGEITPFGDMEHVGLADRAPKLRSLLLFYSLKYNDPALRWWCDLLGKEQDKAMDGQSAAHCLLLPDTVVPVAPKSIAPDAAFTGIGWAALHSGLSRPESDLMVLFKSSPFGADSHSHADQNSFAIMKGGKALAIPAGARYPQHGSPFHTKYTTLTMAHNALLFNGKGQVDRSEADNGKLTAFRSLPHIGYAAGKAQNCYGPPVTRFTRHVVLIRPSLVLIVDDLEMSEPAQVEWLMHAKEQLDLNEKDQTFVSHRNGAAMQVRLLTPGGFDFRQTDAWPIDPKEGYPMVTSEPPAKQWHFTAKARERGQRLRIAAIMSIADGGEKPECEVKALEKGAAEIATRFPGAGQAKATLNLSVAVVAAPLADSSSSPLVVIEYEPEKGPRESLTIP